MSDRVLIIDDHALVAVGLQLALAGQGWVVETSDGSNADEVIAHAHRFAADCVLLDIDLGAAGRSGLQLIEPLLSTGAQVVMLTAERRRTVLAECIEAGAAGWIGKGALPDDVGFAVRRLVAGERLIGRTDRAALLDELRRERERIARANADLEQLTKRESIVLEALTEGLSAEEIARAHYVSISTVRTHIRAVLRKLGVRSQIAAVAIARDRVESLPHRRRPDRDQLGQPAVSDHRLVYDGFR
jgi:DNA-binding NarL/FixJ family response regulator